MATAKKKGRKPKAETKVDNNQTKVSEVNNAPTEVEEPEVFIPRGPGVAEQHLVYVDGHPRYLTKGSLEVLLKQNGDKSSNGRSIKTVEFPKGSKYDIPEYLKGGCDGCG